MAGHGWLTERARDGEGEEPVACREELGKAGKRVEVSADEGKTGGRTSA